MIRTYLLTYMCYISKKNPGVRHKLVSVRRLKRSNLVFLLFCLDLDVKKLLISRSREGEEDYIRQGQAQKGRN